MRRFLLATFTLALLTWITIALVPSAIAVPTNVNCNNAQNLQSRIDTAQPGSTVLIKGTCVGNFVVNKNLRLKGNPSATLDGNNAGTTLTVTGTNVHLTGLVITRGIAATGGGINAGNGNLSLLGVTVKGNTATGSVNSSGGGIYSVGSLTIESSAVVNNRAVASGSGATNPRGGGIYSAGTLTLSLSDVSSNLAKATSTSSSAEAIGGGIDVEDAPVTIAGSTLNGNRARANGVTAAGVDGGALFSSSITAGLSVSGSTFRGNTARSNGGAGFLGAFAVGGAVDASFGTGSFTRTTFIDNEATANCPAGRGSSSGGAISANADIRLTLTSVRVTGSVLGATGSTQAFADGGGLFAGGDVAVRSSSFTANAVSVKSGTDRASGEGGGFLQSQGTFTMTRSTLAGNRVSAGSTGALAFSTGGGFEAAGGGTLSASTISGNTVLSTAQGTNPASAFSGGMEVGGTGPFSVVNSTVTGNAARAVASPTDGEARAAGGGLEITDQALHVTNSTVARNHVTASADTMHARSGGLEVNSTTAATLKATILALNTAPVGPDCFGDVASNGYNLLKTKTNACTFAKKTTDKLGKDPKLGPLANNGGRTKTLALLTGSPALNAIPKAACAVHKDQRGVSRPQPQGGRCDIGSFEKRQT